MKTGCHCDYRYFSNSSHFNGKGRHSAGLNFGDCFPYALAKAKTDFLLFKGNDFSKTDIKLLEDIKQE